MATQKCPRCESSRVRLGYRSTSLFKKLTFRYNLLCDECNWEFVGFAIPGTVSSKTKKRRNKVILEDLKLADETVKEEIENKDFLLAQKQISRKPLKKQKIKAKKS